MNDLAIRPASLDDAAAIHAIYVEQVLHGTASWEYEPPTLAEMTQRMRAVLDGGFPYLAADLDGALAAYTYVSTWRARIGYRFTVEDSIYVRADLRGKGVGKRLLTRLMQDCADRGAKNVIAVIGDSANLGSINLHRACGFEHAGLFKNVGYKFDRWLDSVWMHRVL